MLLARLAASIVRGGMGLSCVGVAAVLVLLVDRGGCCGAVEENARFQRHGAALRFENGRYEDTRLGFHIHIFTKGRACAGRRKELQGNR